MADFKTTLVDGRRFEAAPGAPVSSARCLTYGLGQVRKAVRQCLEELPDLQELFQCARNVLLKPNLLSSRKTPDDHVNTHPAVVRAIAELLIGEFKCQVSIGDSCGTLTQDATAMAIRNSGMDQVADAVGARIYNVDAQPPRMASFERSLACKELPLPANLDQFDLVISVGKMKTHGLTGMTGAVKNMLGLVPGGAKKQAHLAAPRPEEFAALLCDLYDVVRPGAAFMDGVVAMEGRGPANGNLRHVELIAASRDPVALDSFCAEVMGFEPLSIPLLAQCRARGLGEAAPAGISIRGQPPAAFALPDFAKPATYASGLLLNAVPRWLCRAAMSPFIARHASINQDRCRRCGECAANCPSHAISLEAASGRYSVDRRRCISCCCCDEVCAWNAVSVQRTALARAFSRLRSPLRRRQGGA
jgi:uncharacterized protein (DUF362 family)/Pyruvate/2-oxoacid:ferredoxin oxidoreductase delta subunit